MFGRKKTLKERQKKTLEKVNGTLDDFCNRASPLGRMEAISYLIDLSTEKNLNLNNDWLPDFMDAYGPLYINCIADYVHNKAIGQDGLSVLLDLHIEKSQDTSSSIDVLLLKKLLYADSLENMTAYNIASIFSVALYRSSKGLSKYETKDVLDSLSSMANSHKPTLVSKLLELVKEYAEDDYYDYAERVVDSFQGDQLIDAYGCYSAVYEEIKDIYPELAEKLALKIKLAMGDLSTKFNDYAACKEDALKTLARTLSDKPDAKICFNLDMIDVSDLEAIELPNSRTLLGKAISFRSDSGDVSQVVCLTEFSLAEKGGTFKKRFNTIIAESSLTETLVESYGEEVTPFAEKLDRMRAARNIIV